MPVIIVYSENLTRISQACMIKTVFTFLVKNTHVFSGDDLGSQRERWLNVSIFYLRDRLSSSLCCAYHHEQYAMENLWFGKS